MPLTLFFGLSTLSGLVVRKKLAADWILKRQFACFAALGYCTLDGFLVMNTFMEETSNKYFGKFSDKQISQYWKSGITPETL